MTEWWHPILKGPTSPVLPSQVYKVERERAGEFEFGIVISRRESNGWETCVLVGIEFVDDRVNVAKHLEILLPAEWISGDPGYCVVAPYSMQVVNKNELTGPIADIPAEALSRIRQGVGTFLGLW